MAPVLGCVADDITGATDLAAALSEVGWRTVLVLGVPTPETPAPGECDAIVVALKSRSEPAGQAVNASLKALDWLSGQGVSRFFIKYCSTFDSTPSGNIGPVTDAAIDRTGAEQVVHAPSYPANGRTVYQGHLFVGQALLSESGMENHPLTPMTDPNLVRVLQSQTSRPVSLLAYAVVATDVVCIARALDHDHRDGGAHVIADAVTDDDLNRVAAAARDHSLLAGGAAFGASWARALGADGSPSPVPMDEFADDPAVILVGSASSTTTSQVAAFEGEHPVRRLTADELADPEGTAQGLAAWAREEQSEGPVLICADTSPAGIAASRERYGRDSASERVERTLALTARRLTDEGVRRIVVAGGETSGAVAATLGIRSVEIGPSIATGVPWTLASSPRVAITFKSGNFGGKHFFTDALSALTSEACPS